MSNLTLESTKELLEIMSDRDKTLAAIVVKNDQFIESLLSVVLISKVKDDITTLYNTYKITPHKAIANSLVDIIHQLNVSEIIQNFPIDEEDLSNLITDSVSNLLYYDRRGDDEVNVHRIQKHFDEHPEAIEFAVEVFRKALIEGLSNNDDD